MLQLHLSDYIAYKGGSYIKGLTAHVGVTAMRDKAFRERRHPSAPRSVNGQPIHGPTGWKLIYLPCTVAQKEAHCASNIVSNSHLFHSKPIDLPIPKIWLLKIWPWKYKVKVRGEVKVLSHNLGPKSYQIVLEIPTGPPVRSRQLWRRTGNFLLIFLQFNVYDLRFKPWGPTTFWLSFQHCILWIHILVCKIWPSKSKVKVITQGHIIGITSYRLISLSFHVDRPSHSWDAAI